jgi:hypothetical protein
MQDWFKNKSVAIVGNSESLFSKNQGEEIDSHECVCRINRGIQIINESCQGKKTNIWAYGVESIIEDIYNDFKGPKTIHLGSKKRGVRVEGFKLKQWEKHPFTDFYVPLPQVQSLYDKFGYDRLSSGLILLDYVYSCNPKKILLYGFDWKQTPTWYYHELETVHRWDDEKKFVTNNFLNKGNIFLNE